MPLSDFSANLLKFKSTSIINKNKKMKIPEINIIRNYKIIFYIYIKCFKYICTYKKKVFLSNENMLLELKNIYLLQILLNKIMH
jgi:hypothetical protein